ncbi:MAG: hypothetical protein ABSE72_11125 [Bacteroidales bacterium]
MSSYKQIRATIIGEYKERPQIYREKLMKWHSNKENCIRLLNLLSLFSSRGNS